MYEVDWFDVENARQVYHLSIASAGRCSALSQVIDEMLEAGFRDFPGESGSATSIEIRGKFNC